MFVRCKTRHKDGKEHRYWSVVENVRGRGGRVVQRQVLDLREGRFEGERWEMTQRTDKDVCDAYGARALLPRRVRHVRME